MLSVPLQNVGLNNSSEDFLEPCGGIGGTP